MKSINPASGELIREYESHGDAAVQDILEGCHERFATWSRTSLMERSEGMRRVARVLLDGKHEHARTITLEMGKAFSEAVAEVEKCASVCDYYADHAERFLADDEIETGLSRSFVAYRPLGVVLAVMPWNFPFWQVLRFAAPTLMAGNVGVLKHASNVTGCALAIESVFREAGFPPDCFRTLVIGSSQVASVIEDGRVRAVTLTGSEAAGRAVASKAGACLKKTVLELGGSDAYLVLSDADLDVAADACTASRLQNAGQSCIAAKRFVVVEDVADAFVERLAQRFEAKVMGDPFDASTDLGPQARVDLRDELHGQVEASVGEGAELLLGGVIPDRTGAWYPPTILDRVRPGMVAADQEVFGPVAAVLRVPSEEAAIAEANRSSFGLGGAVFSRDVARAVRIARDQMDTGSCAVNGFVKSNPALPFGGVKDSGYGRELARDGIRAFCNVKTVTEE